MRSQAAMEYMAVLTIVLIIVVPLVGYYYMYVTSSVQISQAQESVRKLANAVEYVASGGPGTKTTVYVDIPSSTSKIYIGNKTIMFVVEIPTGKTDVYEDVDQKILGYIVNIPGGRIPVKVTNFGNFIQVGSGMLFDPSYLTVELSKGESKVVNENITDVTGSTASLNYSLQGEGTSYVNVSNFPSLINPGETKTFQINFSVPATARSGTYYMSLISKSNVSYDELPIVLKVLGALKNVIIKFYSDSSYTHEVTRFFPGDTVYFKIINLDENSTLINANTSYNLTNPNSTIVKNDSYYNDVYFGSYKLSNNWNLVHGIWNLSAYSFRGAYSASNYSTFEVRANLTMNLKYNCKTLPNYDGYWWNSLWKQREKIIISNQMNLSLYNYQVKLNINYLPGMNPNFTDIRFIYDYYGNQTEIPYWIENYTPYKNATVWIKVPYLPANGSSTIYMYYNNPTATSESNGSAVFIFFDDFNTLNTTRWYIPAGTTYTISNGILQITRGAMGLNAPFNFDLSKGFIVEAKVKYDSYTELATSGTLEVSSSQFTKGVNTNADATILYMVGAGSGETRVGVWIGNGSNDSFNVVSGAVVFNSTQGTWYILGDEMNATEAAVWKDYQKMLSFKTNWTKNITYISIGAYNGNGLTNIKDTSYDWIRIREYAPVQPTVKYGSTENYDTELCLMSWWNPDWKYRRWINITDYSGEYRTNLPVEIYLTSANVDFSKTNGSDIRFVFNGKEIPYWIQYWNSTNKTAIVWIKLPYLKPYSTETVWLYYGNPTATSESDESKVFFIDNVENGDYNWIYDGLWHVTTRRYNSPTHSFWYGNETTGTYDTGSRNFGYLETRNWIQLYGNPTLSYWEYKVTEQTPGYDLTLVQISTDGVNWVTLDNSYLNDYGSIKTINLSAYADKKVLIRFYFDTVDALYNDYEGWYIDDVMIKTKADNVSVSVESDPYWWNASWHNRVAYVISNPNNALYNYQVKLNINYLPGMNPDFNDIRFVYWNGNNYKIPYWIENYTPYKNATVWIKVPYLPANGSSTIYMYYNNPTATSESNGSAVFIFFDNAENFTGWVNYSLGELQQSNFAFEGNHSILKTANNDPNGGYKPIGTTIPRDVVLEAWIFRNTTWAGGSVDRIGLINDSGYGYGFAFAHGLTAPLRIDKRTAYTPTVLATAVANDPAGSWYFARLIVESNGTIVAQYNSTVGSGSVSYVDGAYTNFTRVYIFGGYDYWVDLIRVREYAPLPVSYSNSSIETIQGPNSVYWNITALDQNGVPRVGNLTLYIYHDNSLYSQTNQITSSIYDGFLLDGSKEGYWTLVGVWNDILLRNQTSFAVLGI